MHLKKEIRGDCKRYIPTYSLTRSPKVFKGPFTAGVRTLIISLRKKERPCFEVEVHEERPGMGPGRRGGLLANLFAN